MTFVAWISDLVILARVQMHRKCAGLEAPFDGRGPPEA